MKISISISREILYSVALLGLWVWASNNAFADLPPQVQKEALSAYIDCSKAAHSHDFALACQACEKGLKILEPYDDKLKVGTYVLYTQVKTNQRDFPAAEKLAQQSVALSEKIEGKGSAGNALALMTKGVVYNRQMKFSLAEPLLVSATNALERAVIEKGDGRLSDDYGRGLYEVFICLAGENKVSDALTVGVKVMKAKGKANPTDAFLHLMLASASAQVGDDYHKVGKDKEAQTFYERSVKLYNDYNDKDPAPGTIGTTIITPFPSIISAMRNLGEIYEKAGRVDEGKKLKKSADTWATLSH